jgi:hypothetical protein
MKYIKPQEYTLGFKLCLSNKHLVIFWVISIGHADYFMFPIVTIFFLWRVQFLATYYFHTRQAYRLLLVQNMHTKYCLCTKYHL